MLEDLLKVMPECISYTKQTFKRGEMILSMNDVGRFVHILTSGKAICRMDKVRGDYIPLFIYEPYSLFGEVEIFTNREQIAQIEAMTKCTTIKIDKASFLRWIAMDSDFALYIMKNLSNIVTNVCQKTANYVTQPVKDRVLHVIVDYYKNNCLDKLSKQQLCYSASAPVRSVNRAVRTLMDDKIIDYKEKKFILLDTSCALSN